MGGCKRRLCRQTTWALIVSQTPTFTEMRSKIIFLSFSTLKCLRGVGEISTCCHIFRTRSFYMPIHKCLLKDFPYPMIAVRGYTKKKSRPPPLPMSSEVVDLNGLRENMEKAIAALKWEFTHSVVSRITPSVLDLVRVEYNNKQLPLKDLGQVSMPDARTVIINMSSQPQAMASVVKAIQETDRGLNPLVEGSVIRILIPKISKEGREKLVKVAKAHSERTKISIRKVLQRGINEARKLKKVISEDDIKLTEKQIQELTNEHIKKVDAILQVKTKELLGS